MKYGTKILYKGKEATYLGESYSMNGCLMPEMDQGSNGISIKVDGKTLIIQKSELKLK